MTESTDGRARGVDARYGRAWLVFWGCWLITIVGSFLYDWSGEDEALRQFAWMIGIALCILISALGLVGLIAVDRALRSRSSSREEEEVLTAGGAAEDGGEAAVEGRTGLRG